MVVPGLLWLAVFAVVPLGFLATVSLWKHSLFGLTTEVSLDAYRIIANEPVYARVLWQTRPGGRTESWFAAIDALRREGRVGRNGMPGPLAFAALLTEYDDVFRLAVGPEPLVRGALAALAPLGRMRGYGPRAA